jgi:LDH2 family malate/lactate/ureidoglycolate dehydrogenase
MLVKTIGETLRAAGLSGADAATVADVFMRATLRGVSHHNINDLPGRLDKLASGDINPKPDMRMKAKKAAVEIYDGDNGLGELHGMFITKRAIAMARDYGVGICGVHNSNHFLAASPYVEFAAESGFMGYIVTRGAPTMGAPGRPEKVSGAAPQGFAVPTGGDYPLMFDACIAYTSNTFIADKAKNGETVPAHWGLDERGQPTTDPNEIIKGCRQPIGGHKGFGLSILGELLTGVLTDGPVIDAQEESTGLAGVPSHTAICIDVGGLHGRERFVSHIREMIDRMKARAAGLTLPGERSGASRKQMLAEGVPLDDALVAQLNAFRKGHGLPEIKVLELPLDYIS